MPQLLKKFNNIAKSIDDGFINANSFKELNSCARVGLLDVCRKIDIMEVK